MFNSTKLVKLALIRGLIVPHSLNQFLDIPMIDGIIITISFYVYYLKEIIVAETIIKILD